MNNYKNKNFPFGKRINIQSLEYDAASINISIKDDEDILKSNNNSLIKDINTKDIFNTTKDNNEDDINNILKQNKIKEEIN
jgi:hypothetical protein